PSCAQFQGTRNGLLIRRLQVRVLPGALFKSAAFTPVKLPTSANTSAKAHADCPSPVVQWGSIAPTATKPRSWVVKNTACSEAGAQLEVSDPAAWSLADVARASQSLGVSAAYVLSAIEQARLRSASPPVVHQFTGIKP